MSLTHFPRLQAQTGLVLVAVLSALAQGAVATTLDLAFPVPAEATASKAAAMTSVRIPVGPFASGTMPTALAEGPLEQRAFRLVGEKLTTLEVMQPLRAQVAQAGFTLLFECETQACGGFDFRYGMDILPEPDMHVDLGDFRYLSAERETTAGKDYISLMVSRSPQNGFVQMTRVGQFALPKPRLTAATKSAEVDEDEEVSRALPERLVAPDGGLVDRLLAGGAVVLEDLAFASGSSALVEGEYASLRDLAGWLQANPDKTVALVGHTDASGGLEGNLALSKRRAQSVRQTLIEAFDLPGAQVIADGVGFLAPRDSNQTDAGRKRNRRVEVMITSTP